MLTVFRFRNADIFSITHATDIHGTVFDKPDHPIAVAGKLNETIVPAEYVPFIDYLNATQLARFGLHNGCYLVSDCQDMS